MPQSSNVASLAESSPAGYLIPMNGEKKDQRGTPKGAGVIRPEHGGQIGNPPFVPTQEQRDNVSAWVKVTSADVIAGQLGISRDTLDRHFKTELSLGRFQAVAKVGTKLLEKALQGNMTAMIFYLKTQGKWSQRLELSGPGGGAIPTVDLSNFLAGKSDEELAVLEPLLEQLLIASGLELGQDDAGLGAPASPG